MISGWCSGPAGACTSPKAHRVCEQRIRLGLMTWCECVRDGGHTPTPTSHDGVGTVTDDGSMRESAD